MGKRTLKRIRSKLSDRNYILTKPAYFGDKNIQTAIELIQYDTNHLTVKDVSLPVNSPMKSLIDSNKVNWIRVTGISDAALVNKICLECGLHGFDVKDLLSDQEVVKVVTYDKVTFILMSSFYLEDNSLNIDDMQVGFILGENFVVSFQEALIPVFDDVKKEIDDNNILIRQKGADFLLYILLNIINLANINAVMAVEDRLAEIEDRLIAGKDSGDTLQFLHVCRVNYTHIKRSVVSLREEFSNLLRNSNKLIKDENIVYFDDFDDRMRITLGDLGSFYESLSSLSDMYYNNNNMQMNQIIKRLTIVSTIFIPLTFLVGVWGMNFEFMPELDWRYGYLAAWIILGLIGLFTYLWMRKQKWF